MYNVNSTSLSRRSNNFDFMRLVFAILVIFAHSYAVLNTGLIKNSTEPLFILTKEQATFGDLAVDFFFIISGFLITQSWFSNPNLFDYMEKRFLRIYPAYFVSVLVCIFLVAPLTSSGFLKSTLNFRFVSDAFTLNFIRIMGIFPDNPMPYVVNASAWTIKFEFWSYVFIAVFGIIGILKRGKMLLLFSSLVVIMYIFDSFTKFAKYPILFEFSLTRYFFGGFEDYLRFLSLFLSGSLFFYYRNFIRYSIKVFFAGLLVLVITAILGGFNIAMIFCGSYIVFFLGFHPRINLHNFAKKRDLSYGTYLYAFPIQQLLIYYIGTSFLNPVILFLIATPLTLIAACISWYLVEKPCLNFKNRKI